MKRDNEITDHMISDDMDFGELEQLRAAFNISQHDVCSRMGTFDATYTRWKIWWKDRQSGCKPRTSSMVALRDALKSLITEKINSIESALDAAE